MKPSRPSVIPGPIGKASRGAGSIPFPFFLGYTGMPTARPRKREIPDNLPANMDSTEICPQVYTAGALMEKRPDAYARIAQGLAQGQSAISLARAEKVSAATVAVIMKREKESIKGTQELTAGLTSVASQAVVEKIIEKVEADEIPAGVLAITFGILRDKERLDLGHASQTIEVKKHVSLDDVKKHLDTLRAERDADLVDVTETA